MTTAEKNELLLRAWQVRKCWQTEGALLLLKGEYGEDEERKVRARGMRLIAKGESYLGAAATLKRTHGTTTTIARVEGDGLLFSAEGRFLLAQQNENVSKRLQLLAKGMGFIAEGNLVFIKAVTKVYGEDAKIEWCSQNRCKINGKIFSPANSNKMIQVAKAFQKVLGAKKSLYMDIDDVRIKSLMQEIHHARVRLKLSKLGIAIDFPPPGSRKVKIYRYKV